VRRAALARLFRLAARPDQIVRAVLAFADLRRTAKDGARLRFIAWRSAADANT